MNSYNELITLIDAVINRNGVQAITGQVLNGVLKAMVQQLGAGYSLSGVAHPTDDPGTPEQPVCYFASEVGTYTNFGGVGIVAGELALLCYDMTDGWFKETMYEGFQEVAASVDENVGIPSVNVTYVDGVLSFDFSNLKGESGADGNDGQDGVSAGFGTITASVDANVGTPSVAVTESGPDTAKNLAFAFHNLKGADGDPGVTSVNVTVDNTSGSPACAVSLNAGVLTLAFTGLKGAQGDTGSSVDYPFTIANNLTTDDATKGLSAAQGVVLDGKVTQLEAEVNPVVGSFVESKNKFDVSTIVNKTVVNPSGVVVANSGYNTSPYIFLKAGEYTFYNFSFLAIYDLSKTFIAPRVDVVSNNYKVTKTLANDSFVIVSTIPTKQGTAMIVLTSEYPVGDEFIPYSFKLSEKAFPILREQDIPDGVISVRKTSFVKTSENLINRLTLKVGYIYSITGELQTNSGYMITDKIPVTMGESYSYHDVWRLSYFDKDGNFLRNESLNNSDSTRTVPTTYGEIDYVICSLSNTPSVTDFQMVKGSTLPPYKPQHLIIDGYKLYGEPDDTRDLYTKTKEFNKTLPQFASVPYLLETDVLGVENTDKSSSAIFAKYDSLVSSYPEVVTRTTLGDDGNGTTLYRYDFDFTNPLDTNIEKRKLFFISGIHPEFAGIYGLYNALVRILSDPTLVSVKSNLHIIVVPVANAYGIDNGSRTDHNGVDLARNFTQDWVAGTPGTDTYGGPSALSEPADQYIDAIMSANTDIVFMASCHSFQSSSTGGVSYPNHNMWGCAATKYFCNLSSRVINTLSNLWVDKYNYAKQFFGYTDIQAPTGSEGRQAARYGIQGGTFEVCDYFRANSETAFTSFAISRATEVYVNLIVLSAECFAITDKQVV